MSCHDVSSIYSVPEILYEQGITNIILKKLNLSRETNISSWEKISNTYTYFKNSLKIGIIGKYVDLKDNYVSVYQALIHSGAKYSTKIDVDWIDSERFEYQKYGNVNLKTLNEKLVSLKGYDGILGPGGFGSRGSEGIINTANFARESNIPVLGNLFWIPIGNCRFRT